MMRLYASTPVAGIEAEQAFNRFYGQRFPALRGLAPEIRWNLCDSFAVESAQSELSPTQSVHSSGALPFWSRRRQTAQAPSVQNPADKDP
nr:MAG TPA_asm: hypothetical protein [Caudoviricetes sp.]